MEIFCFWSCIVYHDLNLIKWLKILFLRYLQTCLNFLERIWINWWSIGSVAWSWYMQWLRKIPATLSMRQNWNFVWINSKWLPSFPIPLMAGMKPCLVADWIDAHIQITWKSLMQHPTPFQLAFDFYFKFNVSHERLFFYLLSSWQEISIALKEHSTIYYQKSCTPKIHLI